MGENNSILVGETPLHSLARSCQSLNDLNTALCSYTQAQIQEMALTLDDQGKLAADVINKNLPPAEQDKIKHWIHELALAKKVKALAEPIVFEELAKEYQLNPNKKLFSRLKFICEAANKARSAFKTSTTHPDYNVLDCKQQQQLSNKLMTMRRKRELMEQQILQQGTIMELPSNSLNEVKFSFIITPQQQQQLLNIYRFPEETGNCQELAYFVKSLASENNIPTTSFNYINNTGDHIFNVFFHHPINQLNEANDPNNWTDKDIICDAWAGQIGLGSQFKTMLGDFRSFTENNKKHNIIIKFNRQFHKLAAVNLYADFSIGSETFEFNKNDYVDSLVLKCLAQCSNDKEKYIFCKIISSNLKIALEHRLISEAELNNCNDQYVFLKKYFGDENNFINLLIVKYVGDETLLNEKIKQALQNGADPNLCFNKRLTPLIYTTYNNLLLAFKTLLAAANVNASAADGISALFGAVENNEEAMIDLLLQQPLTKLTLKQGCKASADHYRKCFQKADAATRARLEAHIALKLQRGETQDAISITPKERAQLIGDDRIAAKLQAAEDKLSELLSVKNISFFKPRADGNRTQLICDRMTMAI